MHGAAWQKTVIENLNQLHQLPLQELDLLASIVPVEYVNVTATSMPGCKSMSSQLRPVDGTGVIWFDKPWHSWFTRQGEQGQYVGYLNVTGHSLWSNLRTGGLHVSTTGGFKLPPGVFLVCGNRAWPSIPMQPVGGPCYLGRLTLFAPHMKDLLNVSRDHGRLCRSIRTFDDTCNDNVQLPSVAAAIATSIFLPGGMAAMNAKNICRLACWGQKQFNLTTQMISELLTDVEGVRHATLQNRAAIGFLLLAHGHGCEDFEGMCCFNLSDHSKSIAQQLATLRENMKHVTEGHDTFSDWLNSLGLRGWLQIVVKGALVVVIVFLILILLLPCLFQCLQRIMNGLIKRMSENGVWIAQKQKGGFVEWLEENGHIMSNPDRITWL
ncbi:syncytin-A-like [Falco peregrinus]|uniref:syncytin-A-like n=1 Tax=Falco peregrinus TaxID=8954 RepID=UPI002479A773|nr:syncytin-A-like [Falco peregrinus]XP_055648619.1 syncytin-A-like [Falco peregrinus]